MYMSILQYIEHTCITESTVHLRHRVINHCYRLVTPLGESNTVQSEA